MSVYTKCIQETNYVTVENHQPVVLLKFAIYNRLLPVVINLCVGVWFLICIPTSQLSNNPPLHASCQIVSICIILLKNTGKS